VQHALHTLEVRLEMVVTAGTGAPTSGPILPQG